MSTYNYIVVCDQSNENYARYIGIGKCGIHPNPKIDIAISDEAISVPKELTIDTIYLDYLPESWVNYILNIGYNSRYTYKFPIR